MTDEELIARLRVGVPTVWEKQAADRIEALVKERDQWIEHTKNAVWADSEELKMVNARAVKAEAERDAANALLAAIYEVTVSGCTDKEARGWIEVAARAHLGAKP